MCSYCSINIHQSGIFPNKSNASTLQVYPNLFSKKSNASTLHVYLLTILYYQSCRRQDTSFLIPHSRDGASHSTTTTTTTYFTAELQQKHRPSQGLPDEDDTSVERRQKGCLLYTNRYLHYFHQTPNICPLYKTYSRYHRHHHNVSIVQQMWQGAEGFDPGAAARQQ
jgi:hypothetical protein